MIRNKLKGKWVEVIDTICEGEQATKDDQERVVLYDSENEVAREVMDCITTCWCEHVEDEINNEERDVLPHYLSEMEQLAKQGTAKQITEFLAKHDEIDTRDMGWLPAEDYIDGRKVIWAKN